MLHIRSTPRLSCTHEIQEKTPPLARNPPIYTLDLSMSSKNDIRSLLTDHVHRRDREETRHLRED